MFPLITVKIKLKQLSFVFFPSLIYMIIGIFHSGVCLGYIYNLYV